eukprot:3579668-Rhodomonas_salina.1
MNLKLNHAYPGTGINTRGTRVAHSAREGHSFPPGCIGCTEHKLLLASWVECTSCWILLCKRRQQGGAQQTQLAFDESLLQGFQQIRTAGCAFCCRLAGGVNGCVFISPPPGCEEDEEGVVYECLRQLYGIPSSALALHVTLSKWLKEKGFSTVGFKDSVWTRPAGGQYKSRLTVSAHIDDLLCACADLDVLKLFKSDFLTRFDGTDDAAVEQYLGCEVIFDLEAGSVTLRQKVYAERVL